MLDSDWAKAEEASAKALEYSHLAMVERRKVDELMAPYFPSRVLIRPSDVGRDEPHARLIGERLSIQSSADGIVAVYQVEEHEWRGYDAPSIEVALSSAQALARALAEPLSD